MPYSKKQKRAAQMALAVRSGKLKAGEVYSSVRHMASNMSEAELRDFSHGKIKMGRKR